MLRGWINALLLFAAVPVFADMAAKMYKGVEYIVFTAEPVKVELLWQDSRGENYGKLRRALNALRAQGKEPAMLMNAGIYGTDGKPAGLWIEQGRELHPLNTHKGKGNFHIQPNGVFWIYRGKAHVSTAAAWQRSPRKADYAVQSGPMLIIDGQINTRFVRNFSSPYTRNAVCISKKGKLFFIITANHEKDAEWPSFYRLAAALQSFGCYNALYLDGSISAYYAPDKSSGFHWKPFVGMIAVLKN